MGKRLAEVFGRYAEMTRDLLYEVFGGHINWYGEKRPTVSKESRRLQREVEAIMQHAEMMPTRF